MELIQPTRKYSESFQEALQEFKEEGDAGFWNEACNPKDVKEYIHITEDWAKGERLPEGWVPASTYWLIENDTFIGHANIRHELTDQLRIEGGHIGYAIRPSMRQKGYGKEILRLTLEKARELGLQNVLVTCDETNKPSRKIIEANGGIFERAQDLGVEKPKKLLYWIVLGKEAT